MSYSPPPTKTPYGDHDFIKEDFTHPPQAQPPFAASNLRGVTYPESQQASPYSQTMAPTAYGQRAATVAYNQPVSPSGYGVQGITPPPGAPVSPQELSARMQSLTPEDRIFLRSWRQDSFYYRVLPLSTIGTGALYYYNKIKGKPHSWMRYLAVSVACFVVGKWSYKSELIRRLETTPLNTPFIQTMRQMTGVRPALSAMGEFSADSTQESAFSGGWSASQPPFPGGRTFNQTQSFSQTPSSAYGQSPQVTHPISESEWSNSTPPSAGGEVPKNYTSYEELRAKNRGLL